MGALNPLFTMVRDYLLKFLPEEKKYSPNTIRSYRKALELLFDYVKEQKKISLHELSFAMIDRDMLTCFLDSLEADRNCSPSTRNHRLNCILFASMPPVKISLWFPTMKRARK